ncbi:MAG TPA: hypothetical protein VF267_10440 [Gammaproteobacteria bacterium]
MYDLLRQPRVLRLATAFMLFGMHGIPIAAELGDPTRPSYLRAESRNDTASREPSWHVESIIVSATRRLAVINGRVVGVDDRIAGARVTEILPYEVRLEYKGEIRRVSLVPTRVKSPAN